MVQVLEDVWCLCVKSEDEFRIKVISVWTSEIPVLPVTPTGT